MNKKTLTYFLQTCGIDALMVLAGLILTVNPDGATALVTKLLGWVLVLGGAGRLVIPTLQKRPILPGVWIGWGLAIALGVVLLSRPMILATLAGRMLGIMLVVEGLHSLRGGGNRVLAAVTLVAGAVLFLLPRTLTNTVLILCGLALMVIGVVNILSKLCVLRRLEQARDPNIIDAE